MLVFLRHSLQKNPDNPEVVAYFHSQLQLMDGDVGDVMALTTKAIDDGRLNFPTIVENKPVQGPDVPSTMPVTVGTGEDQTVSAMGNLSSIAADETQSQEVRDEAGQMSEIFAPVSEEPVLQKRTSAVEITPYGRKEPEIDAAFLKSNASTRELADVTIAKLREEGFEDAAKIVEGYAQGAFKKKDLSVQDINALGNVGRSVALDDTSGRFTETDKANIRLWNETEGNQKREEALKELRGKSEDALNDVVNSAASTEDERNEAAALLAGRSQEPLRLKTMMMLKTSLY